MPESDPPGKVYSYSSHHKVHVVLPGSRPLEQPNVKAPMSELTAVTLREVQGIYQGLVPWAVKDSPPPVSQENRMCAHAQWGPGRPNNCVLGCKDVVRDRFDV